MSSVINLHPGGTFVVRSEIAGCTTDSGGSKDRGIASCLCGSTQSNGVDLSNTYNSRKGGTGVGRMEKALFGGNPNIACYFRIDDDFHWIGRSPQSAFNRESLSAIN